MRRTSCRIIVIKKNIAIIYKFTVNEIPDSSLELPEYMDHLLKSCKNLSQEQQLKVKDLLFKHLNVFAKSKTDFGRTNIVKHRIERRSTS